MNKITGTIVNYDSIFEGEIEFDHNIKKIKNTKNTNTKSYIIPGFIDLHCHGGGGFDTMDGNDAIDRMSKYHLSKGTTSILPTTWTSTFEHTLRSLNGFNSLINKNSNILGVHLEGPFINPNKLGAQPPRTQLPSKEFIENISKVAPIKTITLAPEINNMRDFIPFLIEKNINVQFGHSLADSDCCEKYMNEHKVSFTHLYNAMSDNNHRKPGVLSSALSKGKFAEIICDLNHVSKESIIIAKKCIPDLYAITDAISACGLNEGEYKFAGVDITKKDNKVVIKESSTLAGSIVNMHETFLNLLKINISLEDAVKMTSFSAAKYLNESTIGYLKEGNRSNFLVLDKDLNIEKIFLNGNLINE